MKRERKRRRGVATVELALVALLLFAMLFGIIEFGSIFYVRHNMVQAARETARRLAVQDGVATPMVAVDNLESRFPSVNFSINVQQPASPAAADQDVTVTITAPLSEAAIVDPLGVLSAQTLRAEVTMRKEG